MQAVFRFSFSVLIIYALFIAGCSNPNSPETPELTNLFKNAPVIENLSSDLVLTGSGFISAGTGLVTQPGAISINVPDVTITKVLVYWHMREAQGSLVGDNTIVLNGTEVTGELIGGPNTNLIRPCFTYRADITSLNIINANLNNNVSVDGLISSAPDGAAIVVVYDDGTNASLEMRDGNDFAWLLGDDAAKQNTVPQTFTFPASSTDRTSELTILVADLEQDQSNRPHSLQVTVGGNTNTISNPFYPVDGPQWTTYILSVNIPAGETELTVQLFSGPGDNPSSLVWCAAGLSVPLPDEGCTRTPGYYQTHSEYGPAPYDDVWAQLANGADTPFFLSGQTYLEVLKASPAGNAYYILGQAYIAAELNQLDGVSIPPSVLSAFDDATDLFNTYTPAQIGAMKGNDPVRKEFVNLAGILDDYNNGITGPGHCPDESE